MKSLSSIKFYLSIKYLVLIIGISGFILITGFKLTEKKISKLNNAFSDYYVLNFNRISFPFTNSGLLGTVPGNSNYPDTKFDGKIILFSGGFIIGGYLKPGTLEEKIFANGVYSTRRIHDYVPGKVGMDKNDPKAKIYIIQSSDPPFSKSWIDWKDAVDLGAEFYDGDGDGKYNPVDKNNNGIWDKTEDRPNLIGDFTAWCVYNDGVPKNDRLFPIDPLGIEIHQTIWSYYHISSLANSIFIRYRIIFKGNSLYPNLTKLDSVVFSFVNDPDIGDYLDDLLGTDTLSNASYSYNSGSDTAFLSNPPAIFFQLLQGPQAFIPGVTFRDNNGNGIFDDSDTPITSANIFIDPLFNKSINGAKNLGLNSTNYFNIYSAELMPHLFYYLLNGLNYYGNKYNPCSHDLGIVVGGVNCNDVNPKFVFSGDPITYKGWINNKEFDVNSFTNTERFTLEKDKPVDIIFAYSIGRGSNALNSISEGRKYCKLNSIFFEKNFLKDISLPITELKSRTFENRIDIFWETKDDFLFNVKFFSTTGDTLLNLNFERYELWAHSIPEAYYGNDTTRAKMLAAYDVENDIDNLYITDKDGITIKNIFNKSIQLSSSKYSNPLTGIVVYSIDKNPFTGKKLSKSDRLFFSLRKIYLNRTSTDILEIYNKPKNFLINSSYTLAVREKVSKILEVIPGENFNTPIFLEQQTLKGSINTTDAKVFIEELDKSKLTDDNYSISFRRFDNPNNYKLFWRLENQTKNQILADSQIIYYNLDQSYVLVDGFSPRIEWIEPEIKNIQYKPESNIWFKQPNFEISGAFYMGQESVKNSSGIFIRPLVNHGRRKSHLTSFDKLRKIEIHFGKTQYAYRFVSNSIGTRFFSAAQTQGDFSIGNSGVYFVEVPFQIWVKDERFNEKRQLTCAFLEARSNLGGIPDGFWDPDTNIAATKEYIVIFDQTYDPLGKQMEYVGYLPASGTKVFAELSGWNPPVEANFTSEQIQRAKSPWFDALMVIGLEKKSAEAQFESGDVLTIPISYVLTERDTFYYQSKSASKKLSTEEKKQLVNNINVFPNPYFEWEDNRQYGRGVITFSNLPEEVTIKIYTLSGILVKTLTENNKSSITSPFLHWDLTNESGKKVADGIYLAHIKTKYSEKVLKFSIVKLRH